MDRDIRNIFEFGWVKGHTRVDRKNNVIRGVKLLGRVSLNKRGGKPIRYSDRALKGFRPMQDGVRVNMNHPMDANGRLQPTKPRGYEECFGEIRNVTTHIEGDDQRDGNYGDLHYKPKHPPAELVLDDWTRVADRQLDSAQTELRRLP